MSLAGFSVRRPVLTVMASLILVIVGGVSLARLSIDLMPDITYPTFSISTDYENASPEEVEELVTRPLEQALSAVPGVEEVTSVSAEGESNVRITFAWGTDLDAAANDVRDRLDRATPALPEDAERPRLRKFDLASFPVLILGVSSGLDPLQVRQLIDEEVVNRLERVPGVASVDVRGGLVREIHVKVRPGKLEAVGLSIDELTRRIREENVNLPAGAIERGTLEITLRTPGVYRDLQELRDTVVAVREGSPIQLKEVAAVEDTAERPTRIVRVNGRPGVRLSVSKQSGRNTVEVARGALAEIDRINEDLPQIHVVPIIDTSDYIERSITNVGTAVLYGGALAVFVLLFFLRSVASTAVIATTIPISVVATFALMYFGGFTLNLMTLGGLALGIGMLVDNAIVVLENIYRLREGGAERVAAAIDGSGEVVPAVTASTLTTLVVFLPLVFVRGMSGVMFKQLSYVVSFSLFCSLAVALTLVPMLASHVRTTPGASAGRLSRIAAGFFAGLERGYAGLLGACLRHRPATVAAALLLLAGSLWLGRFLGVELMPTVDEGEVRVNAEMAVGTRLEVVDGVFRQIEEIAAREVPETLNTVSFVGGSGWRAQGTNSGELRIALVPVRERSRSSEEIAGALRRALAGVSGAKIRTRVGQGLFILRIGTGGTDRVQLEVRGHDLATADALAAAVQGVLEKVEGVTDTTVSRQTGTPEEVILVDRQRAADMGLTVERIARVVQSAVAGASAGSFREGGSEYRILVKVEDAEKMSLEQVLDLPVTNFEGRQVVLRNVVRARAERGPVLIERKGQERVVYVTGNASGRDLGSILADVRAGLRTLPVPRGFSVAIGGDYEEQQTAFRELLVSLVLALVLVYMVMAALYESLRDPLVVMLSVPFAAVGVVLALLLTGTSFNIQSFIGCIMLGGIVVNNAILLVDHINLLRRRDGMPIREAVRESGRRRLRPILMTALTTILAMLPLAVGLGEGGEAQAPMARAVVGGLVSSSLISLLVVPTVYSLAHWRTFRSEAKA